MLDRLKRILHRLNANGEIKFLAQGTLYPDIIESVSVRGVFGLFEFRKI